MAHHRTDLRQAAVLALADDARIGRYTFVKAWVMAADDQMQPVWTVATPREQSGSAAKDTLSRVVSLVVALKRSGGEDIEDDLDLDAAAIEAAVWPAIEPLCLHAELDQTDTKLAGEGSRREGSVEVRFACTVMTDMTV